jgi:hypothetical protein
MHSEFFLGQYIAAPYDGTFYDDLDNRVGVLEGGDTTPGSVAKALKDSKDYTDAQLSAIMPSLSSERCSV